MSESSRTDQRRGVVIVVVIVVLVLVCVGIVCLMHGPIWIGG